MTLDNVRNSPDIVSDYYSNTTLLDCALLVDAFFSDIAQLYAYPNWFKGEVVAGPFVKKYWVSIILKYPYGEMPDPEGGMVLINLGCKVFYKKAKQKVPVDVKGPQDLGKRHRPKEKIEPCWLIKIVIPKKFIDHENLTDLELIDKDVDVDDVEDTMNSGNDTVNQPQPQQEQPGGEEMPGGPPQSQAGQLPGPQNPSPNTQRYGGQ